MASFWQYTLAAGTIGLIGGGGFYAYNQNAKNKGGNSGAYLQETTQRESVENKRIDLPTAPKLTQAPQKTENEQERNKKKSSVPKIIQERKPSPPPPVSMDFEPMDSHASNVNRDANFLHNPPIDRQPPVNPPKATTPPNPSPSNPPPAPSTTPNSLRILMPIPSNTIPPQNPSPKPKEQKSPVTPQNTQNPNPAKSEPTEKAAPKKAKEAQEKAKREEKARLEKEQAEKEKIRKEQEEKERLAKEQEEAKKAREAELRKQKEAELRKQKEEELRKAEEKKEAEEKARLEKEQAEKEKIRKEKAEKEKIRKEQEEKARLEKEEKARLAELKEKEERLEKEKAEAAEKAREAERIRKEQEEKKLNEQMLQVMNYIQSLKEKDEDEKTATREIERIGKNLPKNKINDFYQLAKDIISEHKTSIARNMIKWYEKSSKQLTKKQIEQLIQKYINGNWKESNLTDGKHNLKIWTCDGKLRWTPALIESYKQKGANVFSQLAAYQGVQSISWVDIIEGNPNLSLFSQGGDLIHIFRFDPNRKKELENAIKAFNNGNTQNKEWKIVKTEDNHIHMQYITKPLNQNGYEDRLKNNFKNSVTYLATLARTFLQKLTVVPNNNSNTIIDSIKGLNLESLLYCEEMRFSTQKQGAVCVFKVKNAVLKERENLSVGLFNNEKKPLQKAFLHSGNNEFITEWLTQNLSPQNQKLFEQCLQTMVNIEDIPVELSKEILYYFLCWPTTTYPVDWTNEESIKNWLKTPRNNSTKITQYNQLLGLKTFKNTLISYIPKIPDDDNDFKKEDGGLDERLLVENIQQARAFEHLGNTIRSLTKDDLHIQYSLNKDNNTLVKNREPLPNINEKEKNLLLNLYKGTLSAEQTLAINNFILSVKNQDNDAIQKARLLYFLHNLEAEPKNIPHKLKN